jgi:glycosyltransferase involved in cell wall biosynthesis
MRVAIVSTYPPKQCGLATFAADLRGALAQSTLVDAVVVAAIVSADESANPSANSAAADITIERENRHSYRRAAQQIETAGADVVVVQHEYGIFGGPDGSYVLDLVGELECPVVVTLHTVLSQPSPNQREILDELCALADRVTVFTESSRALLLENHPMDPSKVAVVPHGAPPELFADGGEAPASTRISTFGLLSDNKGLELLLSALPTVVREYPDVFVTVAGRTHPEVHRREGERYRQSLIDMVARLDLERHVEFRNQFLSTEELARLLQNTAIYVTPYRSSEQVVSGTLTFALAAGCAVVSTPYQYAVDMLSSGAGLLVPFDDAESLADALLQLLRDPAQLEKTRDEADRLGAQLSWPAVGATLAELLRQCVDDRSWTPVLEPDERTETLAARRAAAVA